ncbi:NUDIX domain-containing protein [Actinoplanes sp. NPDC051346]|uniref:NUDIX domain-containing protein n=1 Tax=Actinoplanes sp. NPDC051346 TaxID=3155048 RepID=UPI00341F514B
MTRARVRATSYITRTAPSGLELLVFNYPAAPEAGTHLPGGGVEAGERPDTAAFREATEETGIAGRLDLRGVVGIQQGTYDTGPSAHQRLLPPRQRRTPGHMDTHHDRRQGRMGHRT